MISNRHIRVAVFSVTVSALGAGAPFAALAAGHAPQAAKPAAATSGKALFEGTCSVCHGIDGSGNTGPNIRHAASRLGPDGIADMITVGFIGSGMPTFPQLGEENVRKIVDYVVSFDQEGSAVPSGDANKGEAIYNSKDCSKCHIVNGRGGIVGPDLTRIGSIRSPGALREALVAPGAKLPTDAQLAERNAFTAYVMQRAVTKDGHEITGMRVNDDSFSVQLRDANGEIHSLRKSDLKSLEDLPGKSLMPSYKDSLSGTELNDLVGYLASLRGAQ